ncbi:MAG TPA: tripartite tricarboxylate transporter substrate-binding protein [Hyphomicrobiaceae bacterium]|nr:tripartite tricarboxylate transporter substrate-binding protein [Hyphomicrobiaceae bacterium]
MAGIPRRTFAQGLAAVAVSAPTRAAAQPGYPAGLTVKFVVGFPAGGVQDIVGRVIADRLGALWKVPTVVENVAGAGGNLGMDRVAKGPSDGSQICIVPPGIATNPYLYARVPFDPEKDFVLLGHVASVPNLLCVRKDLPVDTVAELIAHAKANPGKLNYASSGIGTTVHLSAELFKRMTGVDMVHVAYRGSAPALNDLVGQNVDLMFDNITSIIGQARAGAVKPLGITLTQRSTLAPEFPPIAETVPGYDTTSWTGVAVRAGTPKAICDKIEADTKVICQDAMLKERLAGLVAETVGTGAAEFTAYVGAERAKWGKLITDLRLRVE